MTDTEGPRTEAGKRLLADDGFTVFDRVTLSDILAIEAEARADVDGLVARLGPKRPVTERHAVFNAGWNDCRDFVLRLLSAGDKAEAPE